MSELLVTNCSQLVTMAGPARPRVERRKPFLQRVDVGAVRVVIDYQPRQVDLAALRAGRLAELANLLPLGGVKALFYFSALERVNSEPPLLPRRGLLGSAAALPVCSLSNPPRALTPAARWTSLRCACWAFRDIRRPSSRHRIVAGGRSSPGSHRRPADADAPELRQR